jgi:hypothetical protein
MKVDTHIQKGVNWILTFGKYKGTELGFIIKINPNYVYWLLENKIITLDNKAHEYLEYTNKLWNSASVDYGDTWDPDDLRNHCYIGINGH